MIKLGKKDQTNSSEFQVTANTDYLYASENQVQTTTDSETIARDIKEGRLSGFVGHGTVLTGETNFQMMLRVDGHLTGSVSSDGGTLIIGTSGQVDANISVATAIINGNVQGDIQATEKIQLGRGAKVIGNIQAPRLVLEEGAILEGGCSMLKARETLEKRQTETKSHYGTPYEEESKIDKPEDDDIFGIDEELEEEESAAAAL